MLKQMRIIFQSFMLATCLIWNTTAAAQDQSALTMMQNLADELIAEIQADQEAIKTNMTEIVTIVDRIIMPHTDFELIGKRVLGQHWRTATETQREAFMKEFKLLLIVTYAAAFRSYNDQTVEFTGERTDPNDPNRVEVNSLIKAPGQPPIPVNYRLHLEEGKWLVYDFNVDGVGLTSSFRSQFNNAINNKGFDQVVADMKVKNDEVFNT